MSSFFQLPKWLRRFVRRNTRPIEYSRALAWRERLSIGYAIVAWNAFGMVCYMVYTGRNDWAKFYGLKSGEDAMLSPAQQWAKTLKIENAKVLQFSGLHKTGEFEIQDGKRVAKNTADPASASIVETVDQALPSSPTTTS